MEQQNGFFKIIRWHEDDLIEALNNNGVSPNKENINIALNSMLPRTLKDMSIQTGNEILDCLIMDMKEQFKEDTQEESVESHEEYLKNLTKEDICRKYDSLEDLCLSLDTCFDLYDLGYSDQVTQDNYIELAEMSALQLWYFYLCAKGREPYGNSNKVV